MQKQPLSSYLPPSAAIIRAEAEQNIKTAVSGLAEAVYGGANFGSLSFHIRQVEQTLTQKYDKDVPCLKLAAELVMMLFTQYKDNLAFQTKCARLLTSLLKKIPIAARSEPDNFVIDWKPIYAAIMIHYSQQHLTKNEYIGQNIINNHNNQMTVLVSRARNFFSKESSEEIYAEVSPMLCTHSSQVFVAQAILAQMIQIRADHPIDSWFDPLTQLWSQVKYASEWNLCYFRLLARAAKHGGQSARDKILPLIPDLAQRCLYHMKLPITAKKLEAVEKPSYPKTCSPPRSLYRDIAERFPRLLVLTFHSGNVCGDVLKRFLDYILPFCSKFDHSDIVISVFVGSIAKSLLCRQDSKNRTRFPGFPSALTDGEIDEILGMYEPCLQLFLESDVLQVPSMLLHLANLRPNEVLTPYLEVVSKQLTDYKRPWKQGNVFQVLKCNSHHFFSDKFELGVDSIESILNAAADAIDIKNLMMSAESVQFLFSLFLHTPIPAMSDDSRPPQLHFLEDWVPLALEKLFFFSEFIPKAAPQSPMLQTVINDFNAMLYPMFLAFFSQMTPTMFKLALNKLLRLIQENSHYGVRVVGLMLGAAVVVDASALPLILKALVDPTIDNTKQPPEIRSSATQAINYCKLVGGAIKRLGSNLLPHVDGLIAFAKVFLEAEDAKSQKTGAKLIRHILSSLTTVRPKEYRCLPPAQWNNGKGIASWPSSEYTNGATDTSIEWDVPTQQAVTKAKAIIDQFISGSVSALTTDLTDVANLRRRLTEIRQILKGGVLLLTPPIFKSYQPDEADESNTSTKFSEPKIEFWQPEALRLHLNEDDRNWISSIRSNIAAALLTVCEARANGTDATVLVPLMKTIGQFLYHKTKRIQSQNLKSMLGRLKKFTCTRTEHKWKNRVFRQFKLEALWLARNHNEKYVADEATSKLYQQLILFGMHDNTTVSGKARSWLSNATSRYPNLRDKYELLPIQYLGNLEAAENRVIGATHLLCNLLPKSKLLKKWSTVNSLLIAMLSTSQRDSINLQIRITSVFETLAKHFSSSSFADTRPGPGQIPDKFAAIVNKESVLNRRAYEEVAKPKRSSAAAEGMSRLKEFLMDYIDEANFKTQHWRYQVLASAALLILCGSDIQLPTKAYTHFFKFIAGDVMQLRTLSLHAISFLVSRDKPNRVSSEKIALPNPLSADDLNRHPTLEKSWEGFGPFTAASRSGRVASPITWTRSGEGIQQLAGAQADLWESMLRLIAHDHGLTSGSDGQGRSYDVSIQDASSVMKSYFSQNYDQSTSRAGATSGSAFRSQNAVFFESLIRVGGQSLVKSCWKSVTEALIENDDREMILVGLEAFAGLTRGAAKWNETEESEYLKSASAVFESFLGKCSPNSIPDLISCVRFIARERHPRHLTWISKSVVSMLSDISKLSISQISCCIKIISGILMELSWKGKDLSLACLPLMPTLLLGDTKNTREDAAVLFIIIIRSLRGYETLGKRPNLPVPEVEKTVLGCIDIVNAQSGEKSIEGLIYLTVHALRTAEEGNAVDPYLHLLLPKVLESQVNSNMEIVGLGQIALQLLRSSLHSDQVLKNLFEVYIGPAGLQHQSWNIRMQSIRGLSSIVHRQPFNPKFQEQINSKIFTILFERLNDPQKEVAQESMTLLSVLIRLTSESMWETFIKSLPKPLRRNAAPLSQKSIDDRLAGAMLGAAMIRSCASYVPKWLPDIIEQLCRCAEQEPRSPLGKVISEAISQFKKDHQNEWEETKLKFTVDQMEVLNGFLSPQSYFV